MDAQNTYALDDRQKHIYKVVQELLSPSNYHEFSSVADHLGKVSHLSRTHQCANTRTRAHTPTSVKLDISTCGHCICVTHEFYGSAGRHGGGRTGEDSGRDGVLRRLKAL